MTSDKITDGKRGRGNLRFWLALIGVLLGFLYLVVTLTTLSLGTLAQPGSGFFPILVSILLMFSGVLLFFEKNDDKAEGQQAEEKWPTGSNLALVLQIGLAIIFAVISLPILGFLVTYIIFSYFVLDRLGTRKWYKNLIIALLLTAATYYLFVTLLAVPLPSGIF